MVKDSHLEFTLRKARMISYSQLYGDEKPTVEELVGGIPTDEAVAWCSYLVFRKDNLKIGENDLHILIPLLFSLEGELQQKVTAYLDDFYSGVDCLIDRYSMLRLTTYLIAHHNEESRELTNEEKSRLFKAYLVQCDEYLERIGSIKSIPDNYTSEDMLKQYLPVTLLTNDIESHVDPSIEILKGKWFFIDFACKDKKFGKYVKDFIREKGYDSSAKYLGYIFNISAKGIVHEPPTNIIKFEEDSLKWVHFMDGMSVNYDDFGESRDLDVIRSKPVYRTADDRYVVLFWRFFVDKMFHGMLFDMAATLTENGTFSDNKTAYAAIKQQVGERFSEQYILYRTLENTLGRRMPVRWSGEDLHKVLKSGEPDYYARRNDRVMLFEFKDIRMDAGTKASLDYERIRQKLQTCFVESEAGRPKGVKQIANVIKEKLRLILTDVDKMTPNGRLKIYSILVYTDCSFDIEGINYYLDGEFKKCLEGIEDWYEVKDLVMVNLTLLMKLENYFVNGKIELDKVINEYIAYKNSKEQLNTVPFNKYLFQYARRKGYDLKFSKSFHDTLKEMVMREKEEESDS